mgnify:CR=1 FL=1
MKSLTQRYFKETFKIGTHIMFRGKEGVITSNPHYEVTSHSGLWYADVKFGHGTIQNFCLNSKGVQAKMEEMEEHEYKGKIIVEFCIVETPHIDDADAQAEYEAVIEQIQNLPYCTTKEIDELQLR